MNPHLRMEKILAVIEADPGITGLEIAAVCALPWGIIDRDLNTMLMANENAIPLYTDPEDADITPETKWFLETHTRSRVPLHLTLGEALQILDLPHVNEKHPKLLSLKQKVLDSLDLDHDRSYWYIKGNMTPAEGIDGKVLLLLEQAITRRHRIAFKYKSRLVAAGPLGVVYYSRLRQWYLVALDGKIPKTFSLSRMREIRELTYSYEYPAGFSLHAWLAPRWGMEFGEPLQVKVRFINRSQTFAKVRKDVAHRQCALKEENGSQTLLYEDTVIGKNEFIAWILGFGSTAEVLEPPELRTEIIARVRNSLANYK